MTTKKNTNFIIQKDNTLYYSTAKKIIFSSHVIQYALDEFHNKYIWISKDISALAKLRHM